MVVTRRSVLHSTIVAGIAAATVVGCRELHEFDIQVREAFGTRDHTGQPWPTSTLSAPATAAPLEVVSLGSSGLTAADRPRVRFYDEDGFSVTLHAAELEPLRIAVPPYVDPRSGELGEGATVKVEVVTGEGEDEVVRSAGTMYIQPLPTADGPAGELAVAFFERLRAQVQLSRASSSIVETQDQIDEQVRAIDIVLGAIAVARTGGSTHFGTARGPTGSESLDFTSESLRTLDRVVAAYLLSLDRGVVRPAAVGQVSPGLSVQDRVAILEVAADIAYVAAIGVSVVGMVALTPAYVTAGVACLMVGLITHTGALILVNGQNASPEARASAAAELSAARRQLMDAKSESSTYFDDEEREIQTVTETALEDTPIGQLVADLSQPLVLRLDSSPTDFGRVRIGDYDELTYTFALGGTANHIFSAELVGAGFAFANGSQVENGSMPPAGVPLMVTFAPDEVGRSLATLVVTAGPDGATKRTYLYGTGVRFDITTSALADATSGAAYSAQLEVDGGQAPYDWTITAGSLPDGLSLSADGAITGTPTQAGDFFFTVSVSDGDPDAVTAERDLSIRVTGLSLALPDELGFWSGIAATGGLGGFASNGTAPYEFSIDAGTLPDGLTLNTDGTWSGTPTSDGHGAHSITFKVTDAAGATATDTMQVNVWWPARLASLSVTFSLSNGVTRTFSNAPDGFAHDGQTPPFFTLGQNSGSTGCQLQWSGHAPGVYPAMNQAPFFGNGAEWMNGMASGGTGTITVVEFRYEHGGTISGTFTAGNMQYFDGDPTHQVEAVSVTGSFTVVFGAP